MWVSLLWILCLKFLLVVIGVLLSVAFLTLLERKVLGLVGSRVGPNKVSLSGILQPISDAAKLGNKQKNLLVNFTQFFFYGSSVLMFFSGLFLWSCFFSEPSSLSLKYSLMLFMVILALNSMNSVISGWSSFSKYSLLGSMRTVSQLISYEGALYMCIFFFIFSFMSLSCSSFKLMSNVGLLVPLCFYFWWPSMLAELNRTPYDFSEGESELVSGFNTEFGSNSFTLIFLAEYANIVFFCSFTCLLFLNYFFFSYLVLVILTVLWSRSVLPRYRFDKLMMLAWKVIIPVLTCFFLFYILLL